MSKIKTICLLACLFFPVLFYMTGCSSETGKWDELEIRGRTMGTFYTIKVVVPHKKENAELKRKLAVEIEKLLDRVNRQMSSWLGDSEISRFNRYQGNDYFEVSLDTAKVVHEALRISKATGGAFDVTSGPLIDLWGFGPAKKAGTAPIVPKAERIEAIMKGIGYRHLHARLSPPALKKDIPGLNCNLSAIAKGFGVDKVAEYLSEQGYNDYLVEIGGEVKTRGKKVTRKPWLIGIASPDGRADFLKILQLNGSSMATSGDYHNYFEKDGVRYSHTINPTTGKPIVHKLASVTVVHPSCMLADAMATALNVMGPEKGFELAIKDNLAVYMIVKRDDGFVEKISPRFHELMDEQQR